MTDYWLSKLFFDLQSPAAAQQYRDDPATVLARYPLSEEVRQAIERNDVAAVAPLVNPYLLRYYFATVGMPDAEFIDRLRRMRADGDDRAHG